jgi:hypothetical protein
MALEQQVSLLPGHVKARPVIHHLRQPLVSIDMEDARHLITLCVQSNWISALRAHDWSNRILVCLVLLRFPDENAFTTT